MIRTAFWWVMDRIFPLAEPYTQQQRKEEENKQTTEEEEWLARISALKFEEETLKNYLADCKAALDEEDKRKQSVETRLTTIIGFASIAGTIVFGNIMQPSSRPWDKLLILPLLYLTMQLTSAMLASIQGLGRRGYAQMDAVDILPTTTEAPAHHLKRQIQDAFEALIHARETNNRKVTSMAVAHCAINNFIMGLLVLAVLGSALRTFTPPTPDPLIERLKEDHALRELLRGAQGQPGIPSAINVIISPENFQKSDKKSGNSTHSVP